MLTGFVSAAVLALLPVHPPAATLHYRIEVLGSRVSDGSSTDTATMASNYRVVAFVSVTRRDTTGGSIGRVSIDSAHCNGTNMYSMTYDTSVARASRGVWYDLPIILGDRDVAPRPSTRNPVTNAIAPFVVSVFAPEKLDRTVGAKWSDTLNLVSSSNNYTETGPTITKWHTTQSDNQGVRLEGDITGTIAMSGNVFASAIIIGKHAANISSSGAVTYARITTNSQTLMATQGSAEIRSGHGSTNAEITLIADRP